MIASSSTTRVKSKAVAEPKPALGARAVTPVLLGVLGVVCFSLTFPATAVAEESFNPLTVGAGRSVIAAVAAIAILSVRLPGARRQPLLPPRAIIGPMLVVAATVGVGFGIFSAIALRQVGSVHVAVVTGLIPAATAGVAALRAGERPSRGYWAALALGLVAVVGFAVAQGGGRVRVPDLLLLIAIAAAGLGYAEGGVLARRYGGWRVICWAVVLALPVSLPVTVVATIAAPPRHVSAASVTGLAYLGLVSMCLGFFAWYQAMAKGGVAAIGKLQLAQPALTLGWSALLLGEPVSVLAAVAAVGVIAATALGSKGVLGSMGRTPGKQQADDTTPKSPTT
jgi:drug/metabolite transporter (DMT)-like permease